MLILYSLSIFASAALLFAVEPMIAKMVLPLLGGAPAVWNTCLLFFQVVLLAGYSYVHLGSQRLGLGIFARAHIVLCSCTLFLLPIGLAPDLTPPTESAPIGWLLFQLLRAVGLPAFVLSATAPLVQKLFAASEHSHAKDPYFLYAASNLGSLGALLCYPILIEPNLTTREQCFSWSVGFAIFFSLLLGCFWLARSRLAKLPIPSADYPTFLPDWEHAITRQRKVHWLLLSIVPSSWLMGVTQHLTMDLAPVPMLWVMPLALYLLTFVIAFSKWQIFPQGFAAKILPALVMWMLASSVLQDSWWPIAPHVATFFFGSLACHQELANLRPAASRLSEYYLWMSLGGVLGGAFNAILAPLIFPVLIEYPIAIVFALSLCWPSAVLTKKWIEPVALFIVTLIGIASFYSPNGWRGLRGTETYVFAIGIAIPAMAVLYVWRIRFVFPILAGTLLIVGICLPTASKSTLFIGRSYFGVHRVVETEDPPAHRLLHGSTIHGMQFTGPQRDTTPLTYYHPNGPLGDLFRHVANRPIGKRIGIIGLGTGAIAGYREEDRQFTFFEIDPIVAQIAQDAKLFSFLAELPDSQRKIILGDGRLMLKQQDDRYGILILDAFSSDSIPIHLLTKQAVLQYLEKLQPDGILAFHISNNYLRLDPVLGDLAGELGLACYLRRDVQVTAESIRMGYSPASWVVMSRRPINLLGLERTNRWTRLEPRMGVRVWTDDYSNILQVLALPGRAE